MVKLLRYALRPLPATVITATVLTIGLGFHFAEKKWPIWEWYSTTLRAGFSSSPSEEQIRDLVSRSSAGNAKLEKVLPDKRGSLTGALVNIGGQRLVAWIPSDAKSIMVGALFKDTGENLTASAMKENNVSGSSSAALPAPSAATSPQPAKPGLIDAVEKADGVVEGNAGPLVHVFMDLNCGYCTGLYRQLRPLVDSKQLRVHWIPVAVLHESSVALAAEVLQANNGAAKLAEHETRADPASGIAGIQGQRPSLKTQQIINANSELLKVVNDGIAATPVLIFRGKGGQVFQHAGMLRDGRDVIAAIN